VWAQSRIPKARHCPTWTRAKRARRRVPATGFVDYAVREKLINFGSAATEHPAFARELPRLSAKCDVCFRPTKRDAEYHETDEDEFHYESSARAAERVRHFAAIKDLLTADTRRHLLSGWRVSHPE
jgi:hypothetical protein